jgi:cell fate regulator YaaT (PSP1 superfamily)
MVDDRRGGLALALVTVASGRRAAGVAGPMGKVHRRAEPPDHERARAEQRRQDETLAFARQRAHARGLSIKFFRIEVAPGGERTTFYFSSEQRVDFRELVRDLAARLHHRIELRQVGVRDEAKMVGGIGSCGRELCCSTFLPHFAPVTIRMAKNQNLALNPSRVSGQCGRLKCCLVYEEAQYLEAGKALPRHGRRVDTPDGPGRVEDLDVLRGRVRVSFPDRPPATYAAADLRGGAGQSGSDVGSPGGSDDGPDDGSGSGEAE